MRTGIPAYAAALLLVVVAGGAGCKNKIDAKLKLDDGNFYPDSCRSGQALGFQGVQLTDVTGNRLRLVITPAGTSEVFYFAKGAETGDEVGPCGPLTVTRQNSTINDVTNVEGHATLKCEGGGHKLAGTVTFSNCH